MPVFYAVMLALIPCSILFFGLLWKKRPPKTVNPVYGYRTRRSMESQAAWDFAHAYSGKLFVFIGYVMLALSAAAYALSLILWGGDERALGIAVATLTGAQLAAIFVPIPLTERELKRRFGKGKR